MPSIFATFSKWKQARQRRTAEKLTARVADLDSNKEHDLMLLIERGVVMARATGQSIAQIQGEIQNLINRRLRVLIRPGTYFVASGNYQNMVTRVTHRLTLEPRATRDISITASCINANRPIPGNKASFKSVRFVSDDVARFLDAASDADAMTVQAGIWAITDQYTGSQVKRHIMVRDQHGNTRQAVSETQIQEARTILNRLKINHRL